MEKKHDTKCSKLQSMFATKHQDKIVAIDLQVSVTDTTGFIVVFKYNRL